MAARSSLRDHAREQADAVDSLKRLGGAPPDPLDRYRKVLDPREVAALEAWASTFYQFQSDWLFDESRLAVCNKSRQIGTSHTTAGVGVLWGAFHGELTTIISIGDRESIEVLDKCKRHALVLQRLGSQMANTLKSNNNEIVFHSGGRILALPSSGGRSFSGNVFLDEFAYQEHATKVWDAAAPVTLLGHKMRVVSTPNGVGNEFHQLWERAVGTKDDGSPLSVWNPHNIPLSVAIAQGYPVDIAHCWELAKGDARLFEQMFNCSFLDNVLQYIPGEVIAECCSDEWLFPEITGGDFYAGLDIGRTNDLTCLVVLCVLGGVRYLVHVETIKRTDSDGLEAMVDRAFERYKLKRLCIDSTGLGSFPSDRIKKKHSEKIDVAHRRPRVECIDFTPNSKEALATGLYAAMTGGTLKLPSTDIALPAREVFPGHYANTAGTAAHLKKEIASLRRVITSSANVRYETPHTTEGHGDRAWALMLGLHACTAPNAMIAALTKRMTGGVVPVPPRRVPPTP